MVYIPDVPTFWARLIVAFSSWFLYAAMVSETRPILPAKAPFSFSKTMTILSYCLFRVSSECRKVEDTDASQNLAQFRVSPLSRGGA
jgi:hypothetical protein